MTFYLAPALGVLHAQVNAHYPHRDTASDGWLEGDES